MVAPDRVELSTRNGRDCHYDFLRNFASRGSTACRTAMFLPHRIKAAAAKFLRHVQKWWWLWLFLLPGNLCEHRVLAFLNDQIDVHAGPVMRAGIHFLDSLAGTPLGIVGVIIVLILTTIFVHAYYTAYIAGEPGIEQIVPSFKRLACVLALIAVGVLLMISLTGPLSTSVRILVAFIVCGILGAGANEMFLWANAADGGVTAPSRIATPSQPLSAQGTQMNSRETLASALDDLANQIANAPSVVIGQQTTASGGPGGGTVIGEQVTATAGPGTTGFVIGKRIIATSSDTPVNAQRAQELRLGAQAVRQGTATRNGISTLIAVPYPLGINSSDMNAAFNRATQALAASDLP
jgi:hypothetical protein